MIPSVEGVMMFELKIRHFNADFCLAVESIIELVSGLKQL